MHKFTHLELTLPLVVVAHDAGAANLIIGWLRNQQELAVRTCLEGPAINLWTAVFGKPQISQPSDAIIGAGTLLSGTSHISELEHTARTLAIAHNIPSIGVIDHWVNYPGRFSRKGKLVLPDEIWVSDRYALEIANRVFPNSHVLQKPNAYLEHFKLQVEIESRRLKKRFSRRILYALEPIRHKWTAGGQAGEFQALDYFMKKAELMGIDERTEIRLRPHPSDPLNKYNDWVDKHPSWNINIDPTKSLPESIAWSDTVVGCETYALVAAISTGRQVISTLPPHAPKCRLPMKEIIHLSDLCAQEYLKET